MNGYLKAALLQASFFLLACAPPQENCALGCPTGGSAQTLVRESYTLNNNPRTHFANWVAYTVTPASQASNRPRHWQRDPGLPAGDTLSPADYKEANKRLSVDRGHLAPLAALGGTTDWPTLNYLSNITPQRTALNRGPWARLEDQERALANRADVAAVHSVTGPLFEQQRETLPARADIAIPDGYWKVIFIGASPQEGKYVAFLMMQDVPADASFCAYQVTVQEIERRTRLKIWPALSEAIARRVKGQKGGLGKEMGCG
ncbi:DNA/RNA non-specific endonuclease [Pseudocitrobacter cyperus]|uniref:Endonuclease n=1 Tax=Pseudocitrobacter cyperus TaxID=3112843 RepID=A0ABV0HP55_9ENTR